MNPGATYTGHLRSALRVPDSGSDSPTKKENRNCTLHLSRSDICLSETHYAVFHSHAAQSLLRSFPAFFLLMVFLFFLFCFFCSVSVPRDAKRDVDATATVVRCERTRTERRVAAVEVARLVSPRTAIRPSYTSAAIRAAPSPRRPFSLLLSPARRSRTFPSLSPPPAARRRGPAYIRRARDRRDAPCASSSIVGHRRARDAALSR